MSNNFDATLVGNLATAPALTIGDGTQPRVNFRIAVNDRAQVDGQWVDRDVVFHDAVAWGHLAERIATSLSKGDAVVAAGELDFGSYENAAGERAQGWSFVVKAIGPSVAVQDVTIARIQRHDAAPAPRVGSGTQPDRAAEPSPSL